MILGLRRQLVAGIALLVLMLSVAACGNTVTVAILPTATLAPTATATIAPTATNTAVPATPTPAPGVCDPAVVSVAKSGGPNFGFQYPPLTSYVDGGPAAGNHYYTLCSSGNPASILAFLQTSIPASGWKVTGVTATTIGALNIAGKVGGANGQCPSVNITVGAHAGYPGEWDADFHPPATSC